MRHTGSVQFDPIGDTLRVTIDIDSEPTWLTYSRVIPLTQADAQLVPLLAGQEQQYWAMILWELRRGNPWLVRLKLNQEQINMFEVEHSGRMVYLG